jgi:hypothetical protein
MLYHSTEIADFHLETEIQYMLPQRHKFISAKTSKTPGGAYRTNFPDTLSAMDPERIRHSLASHSEGSEIKSRYRDRLP